MKKIILLFLVLVSYTGFSQVTIPTEYTIQNPLRLKTVNVGSKSDSVLVRGADQIIKYVPQSSIDGSGGGSQNLQQTLENGNTTDQSIEMTSGNSYTSLGAGSLLLIHNDTIHNASAWSGLNLNSETYSGITTVNGLLTLGSHKTGYSNSFSYLLPSVENSFGTTYFRLPINNIDEGHEYKLPVSVNGNFADENGNITISGGGSTPTLKEVINQENPTVLNNGGFVSIKSGNTAYDTTTEFRLSEDNVYIQSVDNASDKTGVVGTTNGEPTMSKGKSGNNTIINIADPIANTYFSFPAKPEGTYTLATLDDIPSSDSINLDTVLGNGSLGNDKNLRLKETSTNNNINLSPNTFSINNNTDDEIFETTSKGFSYHNPANVKVNNLFLNKTGFGTSNFRLPEKDTGDYTLATTDNIPTISQVLNSGSIGVDNYIRLTSSSNGLTSFQNNQRITFEDLSEKRAASFSAEGFELSTDLTDTPLNRYASYTSRGIAYRLASGTRSQDSQRNLFLPLDKTNLSYTFPISVNGNYADELGNITVSGSQNLQQTLDNESEAIGINKTFIQTGELILTSEDLTYPTTISFNKDDNAGIELSSNGSIGIESTSGGIQIGKSGFSPINISTNNQILLDGKPVRITGTKFQANTNESIDFTSDSFSAMLNNSYYLQSGDASMNLTSNNFNMGGTGFFFVLSGNNHGGITIGNNTLGIPQSSNHTTFNLPANYEAGSYNLAAINDIPSQYENTTTTALSSTNLNDSYSTAKKGDTVICADISGGALEYVKTSTGWISRSITAVP